MRAARNSILSQLVAVAWVRGHVDQRAMRAIAGCNNTAAGARIHGAINRGHLVELPGHKPKRWGLSPDRLAAIASMPNQAELRMLAEQTAQRVQRIAAIQAAECDERAEERRAALASAAQQLAQARLAGKAAARAAAKAARTGLIAKAKAAATHEPTAAQRPPMLPGSQLVVPPPAGVAPDVVLADPAVPFAQRPVQDPKGLLVPPPAAPPAPAPFLLRGGLLAPADGPYIRPGAQAHLAAPSRRAGGLVPHRAPLSQP